MELKNKISEMSNKNKIILGIPLAVGIIFLILALKDILPTFNWLDLRLFFQSESDIDNYWIKGIIGYDHYQELHQCWEGVRALKISLVIIVLDLILYCILSSKTVVVKENNRSELDELAKLKQLYDNGVINEEEFNAKKKQLLNL